jgi:hypothetical protein
VKFTRLENEGHSIQYLYEKEYIWMDVKTEEIAISI